MHVAWTAMDSRDGLHACQTERRGSPCFGMCRKHNRAAPQPNCAQCRHVAHPSPHRFGLGWGCPVLCCCRPLVVHFCGNDPKVLLKVGRLCVRWPRHARRLAHRVQCLALLAANPKLVADAPDGVARARCWQAARLVESECDAIDLNLGCQSWTPNASLVPPLPVAPLPCASHGHWQCRDATRQ